MPARPNSRRSTASGRVTPKGTRAGRPASAKPSPRESTGPTRFGAPAGQGIRPSSFRPPAPRSGTRGNR